MKTITLLLKSTFALGLVCLGMISTPITASAQDPNKGKPQLTTSDATNSQEQSVSVQITRDTGGNTQVKNIKIPAKTLAGPKAVLIGKALKDAGVSNDVDAEKHTVTLTGLNMKDVTSIKFSGGATGEPQDFLTVADASRGGFGFDGPAYATLDSSGNYSSFTGGFVTDVGAFSATVTSNELPNTSGDAIAQWLDNALSPEASQFGVTLTLDGSDISVNFDPGSDQTIGGVSWGTTAQSPGSWGSITTSATPEPSTMLLLGSGILGLAGVLRKRMIT